MKAATRIAVVGCLTLSIGLAAYAASAADIPVKAEPKTVAMAAPPWEGFYVGGHLGYGLGVTRFDQTVFTSNFLSSRGVMGGVLAGYNHMLSSRILAGLEGEASWSDVQHKTVTPDLGIGFGSALTLTQRMSYSARARLGVLLTPEALVYGAVGWARTRFDYSFEFPAIPVFETDTQWVNGWQIGAGIETNLGGSWGARVEYLHTFYKSENIASPTFGSLDTKASVGVGRIALLYRFGQPRRSQSWETQEPAPSWTGVYVGGALGASAGSAKADSVDLPGFTLDGVGAVGVLPAGLVGVNVRIAPMVVAGIESEIAPGISTTDFKLAPTVAVRGRLGYLVTPANLIYATGGWVSSGIKTSSSDFNQITIPSQRVNAIQVGGGIESAITNNWLVRFDYQYARARALDNVIVDISGVPFTFQARPQWHYGEVAVVYLFGAP
jgi:outer membrane immunogenic protein